MVDQMPVEALNELEAPVGTSQRHPLSLLTQVVGGLSFTLVWAVICTANLDFWQMGGAFGRIVHYEFGVMRLILLVSVFVVWIILLLLMAVLNRMFLSCGILLAASTIVGLADYEKLQLRREPLYPSDFSFLRQAGFLKDMVPTSVLLTGGSAACLLIFVCWLVGRMAGRRYPRPSRSQPRLWTVWTTARIAIACASVAFLIYLHAFNQPGNLVRRTYEAAGAHWAFWFQEVNYSRHGFVAGFLYNMPVPAMHEPAGYSKSTMESIARRYALTDSHLSTGPGQVRTSDLNVVVILSEAFSDPTRVEGATLAEDPIPNIRALMRRTTSGKMLAQLFGGGTANMEFEALTGQSLSQFLPQMNTPYQMLVPSLDSYPSVVGYLRRQGTAAVAVHPYMTSMYKRYAVYPRFGFQRFVHDTTMKDTSKIDKGAFISDEAAYGEVLRQIRADDRALLVNLVTMQNHYPMKDQYHDPFVVSGVTGDEKDQLAHYARGIRHTDEATRDFLGALQRTSEPTAVVFFGDHLPAIWSGESVDKNKPLTMRQTPYFFWTNVERLPASHEQLTSPIYFLPMLWRELGLSLPPYYNLLLQLHDQIPAMEQGEYYLADGRKVGEEGLPPAAKRVLHDYRMVQYDFSVGRRYAVDSMFPQTDSD